MTEAANPVAAELSTWISRAIDAAPAGRAPVLFLSGPQGAGKSTALAAAISALPVPVAGASIDDFYLTRADRAALAREVSSLFAVRGPPGTHDLVLLRGVIDSLQAASGGSVTRLPVFDKLTDERMPENAWRLWEGRPAAIVIEGWLMGVLPDAASSAEAPINAVERHPEAPGWLRHQEEVLAGAYAALWDLADGYFHIQAPGFECVRDWRLQQEAGLWTAKGSPMPAERRDWVDRFIQHYERLTRRMIAGGRRPGLEVRIDAARRVTGTSAGGTDSPGARQT